MTQVRYVVNRDKLQYDHSKFNEALEILVLMLDRRVCFDRMHSTSNLDKKDSDFKNITSSLKSQNANIFTWCGEFIYCPCGYFIDDLLNNNDPRHGYCIRKRSFYSCIDFKASTSYHPRDFPNTEGLSVK